MRYKKDGTRDLRFKQGETISAEELGKAAGWITAAVFIVGAVISFFCFLPVSIMYYYWLRKNYLKPGARRINNIENLKYAWLKSSGWSGVWCVIGFLLAVAQVSLPYIILYGLFVVWFNIIMARWISVVYFGVIVDPKRDKVCFRQDQQSYDILDYLTLKFFRDLEKIDTVKISDIGKISRQWGNNLYIAGKFGSRKIWFTNKQKRDECIYLLQNSGRLAGGMMVEGEFY